MLIGFLIGLTVGNHVVKFIQRPLSNALTTYYQDESKEHINGELAKIEVAGQASPWTTQQVTDFVEKGHLLADEYYVDPAQMLDELKSMYPKQFTSIKLPPRTKPTDSEAETTDDRPAGLVRLFLWHESKDDPQLADQELGDDGAFLDLRQSFAVGGHFASQPVDFLPDLAFYSGGPLSAPAQYVQRTCRSVWLCF